METKHLDAPFELKKLHEDGEFEGFASTFGNKDMVGDIVLPGAFADAVKNPAKILLLWQHDTREPIGIITELEEVKRGLRIKGQLAMGGAVPEAKKAHELLQMGALNGLSIGFSIPKNGAAFDDDTGIRRITKLTLWEVSIVSFPANPKARVTAIKQVDAFQDLAIVNKPWDRARAERRVKAWAGDDEGRFERAFLGSEYQIGDIVDGELVVVAEAVKAAAALIILGGAPDPDVLAHLELYYAKMNDDPPWVKAENGDLAGAFKDVQAAQCANVLTKRDFEQHLRDSGWARKRAVAISSRGFEAVSPEGDPPGELSEEWFEAQIAQRARLTTVINRRE